MKTLISSLNRLSDNELLARLKDLTGRERETTAIVIAHLAEVDTRQLYLDEGCSSLFAYCTQVLCFSERAAYARIEAARAARKYPTILDRLVQGLLNLTAVTLLAPHLTPDNHRDVLDAAAGRTRRQVEELVACLRPKPPVATSLRRLPMRTETAAAVSSNLDMALLTPKLEAPSAAPTLNVVVSQTDMESAPASSNLSQPSNHARRPYHRATIVPLAPEYYRLQVTIRSETHEKLRQAQELLRHHIPDGDAAEVLHAALADLVEKLSKRKFAATHRPRPARKETNATRYIPAEVRRQVWQRDGGQCAFRSRKGRRCAERGLLEFHHVKPYALGGEATVTNIEIRCAQHNRHEAELIFGLHDLHVHNRENQSEECR